ncbi:MAG: PqqD family peptide modification chaperone [Anaerolineae bacterium]|nr:PqqD family peptide modification chaperone [Anaerolineae bacterium]
MTTEAILYIANPDVSYREEEDGAILFNPDTDEVLVINVTGQLVWQALARPMSCGGIAAALIAQCENVPQDQVAQDVDEFVAELLGRGFAGIYEGAA